MDDLSAASGRTRRAYNLAADRYHELFHDELLEKPFDRELLDSFAGRFNATDLLLDAGCGPCGHIGRHISDLGIPVIGADISDRCVALAAAHNPRMRFQLADLAYLPFRDCAFSGILSFYSIIDTPRREVGSLLREFHRVLRLGGSVLVVVKAGVTEGFVSSLLGITAEIYVAFFTQEDIASSLQECGFEIELLETRPPYQSEIEVDRIYAIATKIGL